MTFPRFPNVVVEIEKRAEPEIGACSRCGALGEVNTLCKNPDCGRPRCARCYDTGIYRANVSWSKCKELLYCVCPSGVSLFARAYGGR